MRAIATRELLNVWERSIDAPWLVRAQNLLLAADADLPSGSFQALHLGELDRRLIQFRKTIFGSEARCAARCLACGADIDFSILTEQLVASDRPAATPARSLEFEGAVFHLRSPTVGDLVAVAQWASRSSEVISPTTSVSFLLDRCVTELKNGELDASPAAWSDPLVNAISLELEAMDPESHHEIALSCPDCGGFMSQTFEILPFLWEELSAWGRRIFSQVHRLASAYGWSEAEILSMSDVRRAVYLEMIGAFG